MDINYTHKWKLQSIMKEGKRSGDWDMELTIPIKITNGSDTEMESYFKDLKHVIDRGILNILDVYYLVYSTPNDAELGTKMRDFINNLDVNETSVIDLNPIKNEEN
jgi:hypothetical protein